MVNRQKTLIGLAVLLAPFAVAMRPAVQVTQVAARQVVSDSSRPAIALQWVIRSRDVIACETPAPQFRALRHEYRDGVSITAVVVASDTALIRSFLRNERLGAVNVVAISDRQFRAQFARNVAVTPMLVVDQPNRLRNVYFADVRTEAGRANLDNVSEQLAAYFHPQVTPHIALRGKEGTNR